MYAEILIRLQQQLGEDASVPLVSKFNFNFNLIITMEQRKHLLHSVDESRGENLQEMILVYFETIRLLKHVHEYSERTE